MRAFIGTRRVRRRVVERFHFASLQLDRLDCGHVLRAAPEAQDHRVCKFCLQQAQPILRDDRRVSKERPR